MQRKNKGINVPLFNWNWKLEKRKQEKVLNTNRKKVQTLSVCLVFVCGWCNRNVIYTIKMIEIEKTRSLLSLEAKRHHSYTTLRHIDVKLCTLWCDKQSSTVYGAFKQFAFLLKKKPFQNHFCFGSCIIKCIVWYCEMSQSNGCYWYTP